MFASIKPSPFSMTLTMLLMSLAMLQRGQAATIPEVSATLKYPAGQPEFTMADLRGKAVIIVFFQSWCGVCNGWSPEFLEQVTAAYGDDRRVALLAVKTDGDSVEAAEAYLSERIDLGSWLVACDPDAAWYQAVTGQTGLWHCAIVDPDGNLIRTGKAGMYREQPKGQKQFSLAREKLPLENAVTVLPADKNYDPMVRRAVTAAEAGDYLGALIQAKKSGAAGELLSADLLAELQNRCDAWIVSLNGDGPMDERLGAYIALFNLTTELKGSPMVKQAKGPLRNFTQDRHARTEIKAWQTFQSVLTKSQQVPLESRQKVVADAMKEIAKRYNETVYGTKAADWK